MANTNIMLVCGKSIYMENKIYIPNNTKIIYLSDKNSIDYNYIYKISSIISKIDSNNIQDFINNNKTYIYNSGDYINDSIINIDDPKEYITTNDLNEIQINILQGLYLLPLNENQSLCSQSQINIINTSIKKKSFQLSTIINEYKNNTFIIIASRNPFVKSLDILDDDDDYDFL